MNWRIEATVDELRTAELDAAHHSDDDPDAEPSKELLTAARQAARTLAKALDGDVQVTIEGHETAHGKGFRPAHITVTTSRLDPKR